MLCNTSTKQPMAMLAACTRCSRRWSCAATRCTTHTTIPPAHQTIQCLRYKIIKCIAPRFIPRERASTHFTKSAETKCTPLLSIPNITQPITRLSCARTIIFDFAFLCPGEDLNLHALRHIHLKDACIPISTPGQVSMYYASDSSV